MVRNPTRDAAMLTTAAAVLAACLAGASGQDPQAADSPPSQATTLDERIDPAKLTETNPPPLPSQVVMPIPADFRLAESPTDVPISQTHWDAAHAALARGLDYLLSVQDKDGGWMTHIDATPTDEPDTPSPISVAVTALAVKAMVQARPDIVNDERFHNAMRYIRQSQNDDGSFEGGALTNYVTSVVVMALSTTDRDDFFIEIGEAADWLVHRQWDESEGLSDRQDWYGGAGYGNRGRPDLSNTQTMLDALYESGMSPDEPAFQRALAFVSRAQNLKATNSADWSGNDGGFVYTPANGGESFASEASGEGRYGEKIAVGQPRGLRSYGSMTYAGFKSMLYAGLSPDDPRVRAAFDWICRHWTFDENPGLGEQGLFYYYHTMSRALRAAQQHMITDAQAQEHNWREELIDALVTRQQADGSWSNDADRWLEAEPVMATVYATLALAEALKPVLPSSP